MSNKGIFMKTSLEVLNRLGKCFKDYEYVSVGDMERQDDGFIRLEIYLKEKEVQE